MKFRCSRAVAFVALIAFAAPVSFGKKADRKTASATVLDRNSYICSNCFFGTSDYYYCFDVGDKILIGYQKVPSLGWKEHETNLLTRVHKGYEPWSPASDKVDISYDDKSIYVTGADGKEARLHQNYQTDIFLHSAQCRAAIHKAQ